MSAIVPFKFENTAVRVTERSGDPWFVLSDVCRVLEIANVGNASARLDDDEKGSIRNPDAPPAGGNPNITVINESGLWSLILTSRKPEAKRFKKWVTSEVLPTLRKTGRYAMPGAEEPQATLLDLEAVERWLSAADRLKEHAGPDAARSLLERSPLLQAGDGASSSTDPAQANCPTQLPARYRVPHKRRISDTEIDRFLSDCTYQHDSSRMSAALLYQFYSKWCLREGITPKTVNAFGRSCRRRLETVKNSSNLYIGIAPRD